MTAPEDFYRNGLVLAIEVIDRIEGWDTPEDEAITAKVLCELRSNLAWGDKLRAG